MDKDVENAPGEPKAEITPVEKLRQMDERLAIKRAKLAETIDELYPEEEIVRDANGRFKKGGPTPNPFGAGAGKPLLQDKRRFMMSQTVKDLLELLEEPVPVRKGKVTKQVPAIVAIYQRMIHMAVHGDWNAMKKIVELREKYSDFRGRALVDLLEEAQGLRLAWKESGKKLPGDVEKLLWMLEQHVAEGQFSAA